MPRPELLDPQGKTVSNNMTNLDIHGVEDVRIGKRIEILLDANSLEEAQETVDSACKQLLANLIMETYQFEVESI